MNKKKLLDSLYNKELMELILNDSTLKKSNARGIADSLTPIVLPQKNTNY